MRKPASKEMTRRGEGERRSMKSSFNEAMMRSLCLLSKMVINACLCAFYSRPGKTAENSSQTTSSCNLPILVRHV